MFYTVDYMMENAKCFSQKGYKLNVKWEEVVS